MRVCGCPVCARSVLVHYLKTTTATTTTTKSNISFITHRSETSSPVFVLTRSGNAVRVGARILKIDAKRSDGAGSRISIQHFPWIRRRKCISQYTAGPSIRTAESNEMPTRKRKKNKNKRQPVRYPPHLWPHLWSVVFTVNHSSSQLNSATGGKFPNPFDFVPLIQHFWGGGRDAGTQGRHWSSLSGDHSQASVLELQRHVMTAVGRSGGGGGGGVVGGVRHRPGVVVVAVVAVARGRRRRCGVVDDVIGDVIALALATRLVAGQVHGSAHQPVLLVEIRLPSNNKSILNIR